MSKKMKIEKGKKREKLNLFGSEKVFDTDVLRGAHTEIFSNSRIVIEGCLGVYEYNDTYLKLRLSKGALILNGEAFDILTFEDKTITVKGKINSLEFCL